MLNRQRAHGVRGMGLVSFLRRLSLAVPPGDAGSLALCLVSDRRMRELNRSFRGHDATTDVLSFPAGCTPGGGGERHLGDIAISVPVAARQARAAGHSLQRELELLALHGYLHLLGHDHETDGGAMLRLQARLARRLCRTARRGARR